MGFSALQGKGVHEALLARQDAEIRLIETMRRCLSQKAKCDRDYATAMVNVAQTGLKVDRGDDLNGSQIFQAWRKFMDEIEQQSKQIRFNAEQLENLCSDRMSQLYQDKRKSRKQYQEEHAKIASQFAHLTEDVARKKAEYQKHLDYYKQLRMRFEEHYIKSGRAGRKLDDVRDKYQKACRKLHLAHNEYVLLIHEATEVEKDYRTILLPSLLDNHQTQQEHLITTWKNLLVEASNFGDLTSDKYVDIQRRVDLSLKAVSPTDEYRDFTEKHRSSSALPVIFRFDDQLIEDTVGKLQPNQLTVDNLTVDSLRQRVTDLESSVKDCQEKQSKIQSESNGKISSSASSLPTSPTSIITNSLINTSSNSMNGSSGSLKDIKFNKDLSSLKCEERQKNKLIEIIKSALNEMSCEELPSGCDDLSVEIENNNLGNHEQMTHSTHMSMLLQKGGDFMALIKTPFKKKRSTIAGDEKRSQSLTPRSARGSTARSNSLGSSVNSYEGSEVFVNNMNESSKNIYADIDNADDGVECGFATNNIVVTPPDLPAENSTPKDKLKILQVPMISELENFEECVEADFDRMPNQFNCSKNNLLLIDDELMTGSIACHLNNIELVNKNLDRLIQAHHQIETSLIDDKCKAEAENKNLKEKIADKIKVLKYARIDSPGTSKGSFKSRVKNMFPKFERQGSGQDDQEGDKVKTKAGPIYDTPGPSTKKVDCSAENAGLSGENASSSGENASLGGENASSGGENADPSPGKAGKINDKLGDEKIKKFGKKFLSSFKRKQPSIDETDEVFEEIRKVSSDVLLTKLEDVARLRSAEEAENGDSKVHDNDKEGKLSSRFKSKFKSAKHLVTSKVNKIPLKVHHKTCRKCSKKSRFSSDGVKLHHSRMVLDFNVVDNELCVCVDVDDDFDDDGICIKNFEFKGVSFCIVAILA